ncbi:MAG TPA: 16S rRNA (uracil(1498)-N(3))-methyltransferase [Casimicrobiaceae bacterium]|nr:16S rRNA (uracil(1498)-N(3))-methyltransferase [Casimicrobiaceae bacterium]
MRSPGAFAGGLHVTPRFFCPPPVAAGTEVALPAGAAHHAARVLRLAAGAAVTLFDGEGGECAAQLSRVDGRGVIARINACRAVERESPLAITLVQGLAAADRMDYAIRKAVELGVAAIVPVRTARSVARLDRERALRRLEHWRQIIVGACEQCGRNRLPAIRAPCDLLQWLRAPSTASMRLLPAPDASQGLSQLAQPEGAIELLVGPEGGLAPEESAAALAVGFRAVRLGPRILRTETVAPAALAAMNALWGDWR